MRNPWAWLVDRLWPKPSEASDAAAYRIVCGTPHAWAAEERQAAEWVLADKAQSYDGVARWGEKTMIKAFKAVALGLSLLLANVSVCSAQEFQKAVEAATLVDAGNTSVVPETIMPESPRDVRVGTYIIELNSLDLETMSFRIKFWIWFRWNEDDSRFIRDPLETFDVVSGRIESKTNVFREKFSDGTIYAVARVDAEIHQPLDPSRFPLDSHTLELKIQPESDASYVRYVPDVANSKLDKSVFLPGWILKDMFGSVSSVEFSTSYGYEPTPSNIVSYSEFSEFKYLIGVSRPILSAFFKTFWATFLSVMLALLMFVIPKDKEETQFQLGVGSIFAATANYYIISSNSSSIGTLTLADSISFLSVFTIFVSISAAAFCLAYRHKSYDSLIEAAIEHRYKNRQYFKFMKMAYRLIGISYLIGLVCCLYIYL